MTKILVIEDEPDVREIILDILHEEAYAVIGAENGQVGIEQAVEQQPDLIICDVMMPKLDGYEVLKYLRENSTTSTIPFVFLTAKTTHSDRRQGMNLGADDYLTKPFTRHELLSTIVSRMQKHAIVEQKTQEKLDELRGNITLSLPHQLRTPLNGILALSDLLREDWEEMTTDEIQESLGDIHQSAQRLYRLVSNFLLYADLEIIHHHPDRRKILLKGQVNQPQMIIQNTVQTLLEAYPERTADIVFNLQGQSSLFMSPEIFKKILEELVDNALKFSQPGERIEIKTNAKPPIYSLEIVDRGQGMSAEKLTRLGLYQTFDRSRYEQQGLGLGLVIVKRLVELQQGTLNLNSIPQQGTIIQLQLPVLATAH